MFIVHVLVHVNPEDVEAFKAAAMSNAAESLKERGVARFDVLQREDDPTRFILAEVYHGARDALRHKETAHYQKWRDAVAPMMAEPRSSIKSLNIFPADSEWGECPS